jgi:hypothetical protein
LTTCNKKKKTINTKLQRLVPFKAGSRARLQQAPTQVQVAGCRSQVAGLSRSRSPSPSAGAGADADADAVDGVVLYCTYSDNITTDVSIMRGKKRERGKEGKKEERKMKG